MTTAAPLNLAAGRLRVSKGWICSFFVSVLCCVLSIAAFVLAYAHATRLRPNDHMAAIEFAVWGVGLLGAGVLLRFGATGHLTICSLGRFPGVLVLIRALAFAFGILVIGGALPMLFEASLLQNRLHLHWFDFDLRRAYSIPPNDSIIQGHCLFGGFFTFVGTFLLWGALRGLRLSRAPANASQSITLE